MSDFLVSQSGGTAEQKARFAACQEIALMDARGIALLHFRKAFDILNEFEPELRDYDDERSPFSRRDYLRVEEKMERTIEHLKHIVAVAQESAEGGKR